MLRKVYNTMFSSAPSEIDIEMGLSSTYLEEIHTNSHALTFFHRYGVSEQNKNSMGTIDRELGKGAYECFQWFEYERSTPSPHTHINVENFRYVTPAEFDCYLAKYIRAQDRLGICQDGKTNCLLSHEDANIASLSYKKFYNEMQLERKISIAGSSFLHAFLTTLIDSYLKPTLIQKKYEENTIYISTQICNYIVSLLLSNRDWFSLLRDHLAQPMLREYIQKYVIDDELLDQVLHAGLTVAILLASPLPLYDIIRMMLATAAGKSLAHFAMTSGRDYVTSLVSFFSHPNNAEPDRHPHRRLRFNF